MTSATATSARFVTCHSILQLDAHHPYTAKALLDAQDMHRTVMSGFLNWVPDGEPDARAQLGVLSTWNLDLKSATLLLIVQSRIAPDWSRIPSAALSSPITTIPVDCTIRTGDRYVFRTVVNPTRDIPSAKVDGAKAGPSRRRAHTVPKYVRTWFEERLQPLGQPATGRAGIMRIGADANPETLALRTLPPITSNGAHKGLKIARAEIKGMLTVTDPTAFARALAHGLGRGRAYSCGLILTKPGGGA